MSPKRAAPPKPRIKVWVTFGGRVKFGDGRAHLLQLIDDLGSFRRAVDRVGMSYRGAWGYFRELERAAGFPLLERRPGGGPAGGTRLTKEGRAFLERYRKFRESLDPLVERRFRRWFGRPRSRPPRRLTML